MPVQHVAAASVVVKGTQDAVFDVIADVPVHVKWAEGIDAVNALGKKFGDVSPQVAVEKVNP